jgi:hypothetical protein
MRGLQNWGVIEFQGVDHLENVLRKPSVLVPAIGFTRLAA